MSRLPCQKRGRRSRVRDTPRPASLPLLRPLLQRVACTRPWAAIEAFALLPHPSGRQRAQVCGANTALLVRRRRRRGRGNGRMSPPWRTLRHCCQPSRQLQPARRRHRAACTVHSMAEPCPRQPALSPSQYATSMTPIPSSMPVHHRHSHGCDAFCRRNDQTVSSVCEASGRRMRRSRIWIQSPPKHNCRAQGCAA
jgi:hypothetical protein